MSNKEATLSAKPSIDQYKILHSQDKSYGTTSAMFLEEVSVAIDYIKPATVLDYGCGKGVLLHLLAAKYPTIQFYGYDPAIPGRETIPKNKFDMVINTDVLEHIPEDELPSVLDHISSLSDKVYFNLHHALAKTILPNGENAHCTVKPPEWYRVLLERHFHHVTVLKGRRKYLSVVMTFPLPPEVENEYYQVLERVSRRPLWKRILRKITFQAD